MELEPLRVCFDREISLSTPRVQVREWPGLDGPAVHVNEDGGDPAAMAAVAAALAPGVRVLSLTLPSDVPYQTQAQYLAEFLDVFGFARPVLLGGITVLLVAAWLPERVAGLVLAQPRTEPGEPATVPELSRRDCPPDVDALRARVACPVLLVDSAEADVHAVESFVARCLTCSGPG